MDPWNVVLIMPFLAKVGPWNIKPMIPLVSIGGSMENITHNANLVSKDSWNIEPIIMMMTESMWIHGI